ncbi:hypothetical protein GCM10011344_04580 [Dokdonia pacifica]|uniref:DUF192 domain-containing protein n=1 Tax=Dokdonia pacifica TaxID=1627892 RepID=A0A238ZKT9_9FLAO|nr:DUF192 domain-containing protein [Dokdonia pacifica]GGG07154.1 hypothetical protein GCM10011344_04580 [Dokdonia pacifica]SNR84015.1 hypothetical protein SAMN06265376_103320 [Dokdonia pacifica]
MKSLLKIVLVIFVSITITNCKETKEEKVITETEFVFTKEGTLTLTKANGTPIKTIAVEFAEDDYERETGLMHRSSMKPLQGMLFIQDVERIQNFYMKNTLIPLDLIFIDSNKKVVSFAENAKPLDLTSLSSQVPAKYVLEINGGLSEEWVIEIGDTVEWTRD